MDASSTDIEIFPVEISAAFSNFSYKTLNDGYGPAAMHFIGYKRLQQFPIPGKLIEQKLSSLLSPLRTDTDRDVFFIAIIKIGRDIIFLQHFSDLFFFFQCILPLIFLTPVGQKHHISDIIYGILYVLRHLFWWNRQKEIRLLIDNDGAEEEVELYHMADWDLFEVLFVLFLRNFHHFISFARDTQMIIRRTADQQLRCRA